MPGNETSARISVGIGELLRSNRNFRNLWYGQVVSEMGDWFSTVALLNLMLQLTGRAQTVGWFFIFIYLPAVFVGPVSGVLVDRLDRKKVMIAMDLVRAALVLGYMTVRRPDQIWIIYVVAALELAMSMFFEPARNSIVPDLCDRRELMAANALGSITWSTVLAAGAAVGGFATAYFGRNVCYIADSVSFLASALFISRVSRAADRAILHPPQERSLGAGFRDMARGFAYMRACPRVLALTLVKTGWALGGGVLLLISIFGEKFFPIMGSGAAGIGVLYAARGIGAALGPILARRLVAENSRSMRNAITVGFLACSVFYTVFGQSAVLWAAALALAVANMGSSSNWVFSTVLLQMEVPNEFRGRVFATEIALVTLGIALSNYVAGYCLDILQLGPRTLATLIGVYFLVPALLWSLGHPLFRRPATAPEPRA